MKFEKDLNGDLIAEYKECLLSRSKKDISFEIRIIKSKDGYYFKLKDNNSDFYYISYITEDFYKTQNEVIFMAGRRLEAFLRDNDYRQ